MIAVTVLLLHLSDFHSILEIDDLSLLAMCQSMDMLKFKKCEKIIA